MFFAGGRDKRGGPILTFPARSNHDRIKQEDLRRLVTYLSTVPRYASSQAVWQWCSVRHHYPGIKPSLDLGCRRSRSPCLGFCLWSFAEKSWSVTVSVVRSEPCRLSQPRFLSSRLEAPQRRFPLKQRFICEASVSEETSAAGKTTRSSADQRLVPTERLQ